MLEDDSEKIRLIGPFCALITLFSIRQCLMYLGGGRRWRGGTHSFPPSLWISSISSCFSYWIFSACLAFGILFVSFISHVSPYNYIVFFFLLKIFYVFLFLWIPVIHIFISSVHSSFCFLFIKVTLFSLALSYFHFFSLYLCFSFSISFCYHFFFLSLSFLCLFCNILYLSLFLFPFIYSSFYYTSHLCFL